MGKLFGDWGRARQAIGRLASGESVNSDLKNAMTLGDFIRNLAYEHIDKQDLQWKPLSPFTVKRKGTDKIMVDTGEYKENIVVKVERSFGKVTVFVGPSDKKHRSGPTMQEIAKWLEYGTVRQPPRPLWFIVYEEAKRGVTANKIFRIKL